jgi:hypothetical protein
MCALSIKCPFQLFSLIFEGVPTCSEMFRVDFVAHPIVPDWQCVILNFLEVSVLCSFFPLGALDPVTLLWWMWSVLPSIFPKGNVSKRIKWPPFCVQMQQERDKTCHMAQNGKMAKGRTEERPRLLVMARIWRGKQESSCLE